MTDLTNDPRLGTPIYALLSEYIDPEDRPRGGLSICSWGSSGERHPYIQVFHSHPEWDRPDLQDRALTLRLAAEVRVRDRGITIPSGRAVPCPYCRGPLMEPGPHTGILRDPIPEWQGSMLGWVHRSCQRDAVRGA